jgi:hypothetical protein
VSIAGKRRWFVPDGYLPGTPPSHESACVLNVGPRRARLQLTFFLEDREPLGPVEVEVGARRTAHIRLDDSAALGGVELPRDVPYAYSVESDEPVVLQHSRLDTTGGGYTLFTTVAYGE